MYWSIGPKLLKQLEYIGGGLGKHGHGILHYLSQDETNEIGIKYPKIASLYVSHFVASTTATNNL